MIFFNKKGNNYYKGKDYLTLILRTALLSLVGERKSTLLEYNYK